MRVFERLQTRARPHANSRRISISAMYQSVFDFAREDRGLDGPFARCFGLCVSEASCCPPPPLAAKYSVPVQPSPTGLVNTQFVVGITSRLFDEQVWFNEARKIKPQTFTQEGRIVDPTDNGARCDFCRWEELTAADPFGRVERRFAVAGSNLFKYGEQHGLVLFRHHDPLQFSREQLADLLRASHEWLRRAAAASPSCRHPLFLWNCLPRSGASQFHGHAQAGRGTATAPCC